MYRTTRGANRPVLAEIGRLPLLPDFGTPRFLMRWLRGRTEVTKMNAGEELATAGLVLIFAAVLLVFSHLFIDFKAKQLVGREQVATIRR